MDSLEHLKLFTFVARMSISVLGLSLIYYTYRHWISGYRYTKDAEYPEKVVIVTGASRGIGKEVAYGLAKRGLHVIMACRDLENGLQAQNEIIEETGNQNVKCMYLDLSSFKSIRNFASEFLNTGSRLDILINNANVLHLKRLLSHDDIEQNMAINYFGHFLLTMLLIQRMSLTVPTRIINVTNWLHRCVDIDPTDLMNERQYCGFLAYARSTLANVYFTIVLTERIESTGITCNCVHPGISLASFIDRQKFSEKWKFLKWALTFLAKTICKSDRTCSEAIISAAVDFSFQNISGIYLSNSQFGQIGANAENRGIAEWVWNQSEKITAEKLCELPKNLNHSKKPLHTNL